MENLIERVWDISVKNPEGFTYHVEKSRFLKTGLAVAYLETQNSFNKDGLRRVLKHTSQHDKIVGRWFNAKNGLYYFDSVKTFKNNRLEEALKFAKDNKQTAIFDLTNIREIEAS